MPTAITWNGSARNVPNAGELNWASLTNFLVDLGNNAQTTNFQKIGARIATTTPVTVLAATDCLVVTNMAVASAVTVNLPAGVLGQMFIILDGKNDAATNNITIDPNGAETISGGATRIIDTNRGGVIIAYDGTTWRILAEFIDSDASVAAHAALTTGVHGVTGTIVGTSDTQSLTNKIIVAGSNTISGLLHGTQVDNPSSGVHGVTGSVVGTTDTQTLSNKSIDADTNTITNIENADIKAAAAIARTKLASGTANHVIINDGTGVLSSEAALAISRGGSGQTTQTAAFDALSPLTTKGDLIVYNGTDNVREPVGANGTVVMADSAQASGIKWASVASDPTTTRGELIRRGAAALEAFAAQADNNVVRGDGTDVVSGKIDDPAFFTTGAAASATDIGIVTTGTQSFAGNKTFTGLVTVNDDFQVATNKFFVDQSAGQVGINTNAVPSGVGLAVTASSAATGGANGMLFVQSAVADPGGADYLEVLDWGNASTTDANGGFTSFKMGGTEHGSIKSNGAASVAYNTTSDARLKEDFKDITEPLKTLSVIKPIDFAWKSDKSRAHGFLAQALHCVYPQAVSVGGEDAALQPWSVDYSKLVPLLVSCVQVLVKKVEELESKK